MTTFRDISPDKRYTPPTTYLTRRTNANGMRVYAVIARGSPVCADKPTESAARDVAASLGLTLAPELWDGDTGKFVSLFYPD